MTTMTINKIENPKTMAELRFNQELEKAYQKVYLDMKHAKERLDSGFEDDYEDDDDYDNDW